MKVIVYNWRCISGPDVSPCLGAVYENDCWYLTLNSLAELQKLTTCYDVMLAETDNGLTLCIDTKGKRFRQG
jgi:hypothetical protein